MADESILVTGAAGFIGYHVARALASAGRKVVGLDNLNSYYDPKLKEARLRELAAFPSFQFVKLDLADREGMATLFARHRFPRVVHLGAQAGVRHSLVAPHAYVDANLQGFLNVLEGCRHHGCGHLVFASSSSVYGGNTKMPFATTDDVDHPISLYAATKKANELMAHAYSHLFRLPATGLRFFTVYGPWGRPDMAVFMFASAIAEGKPIKLFNFGKMRRDFTYIDDVTEGVIRVLDHVPVPVGRGEPVTPATSTAPWRVYNVGNSKPVDVPRVVELLEAALGRKAKIELAPMQLGDVPETYADISDLVRDVGFRPSTSIEDGIKHFVEWYRGYRRI